MTNDKADFTQGSILKKLVAFMMPVLGALILQAELAEMVPKMIIRTEIIQGITLMEITVPMEVTQWKQFQRQQQFQWRQHRWKWF